MKYLSNIDLCKNELQNARLQNLGTAPANPGKGQVYYNSADNCFYGFNGSAWIDLGQVLNGTSIVNLINGSTNKIDDDNLSTNANDAITKRHSHSNSTILNAMEQAFTTALKNKLDGIAAGANEYVHPSSHPATMIIEDSTHRWLTDVLIARWNVKTGKYSETIGNGSLTTIPVTHGLNTMDIVITVREAASPYTVVYPDIQTVDANKLNILFASAPATGQFRVTVVG